MWKLLTGVIAAQIYAHLHQEKLLLEGVTENIKSFLVNSMDKWKVMLCSGNSELIEVEIRRNIFQGDSLSPSVFV